MRWDALFDDLEAQARAIDERERAGEVEERARLETARLSVLDRLRAAENSEVRLRLHGQLVVAGTLRRLALQWLLLEDEAHREYVVPLPAVLAVGGLSRLSETRPASRIESRLGLGHVLRGVARDRSGVVLSLLDTTRIDGTIDRVGADFLEIAVHAGAELRRRQQVHDVLLVPFTAVAMVTRTSGA